MLNANTSYISISIGYLTEQYRISLGSALVFCGPPPAPRRVDGRADQRRAAGPRHAGHRGRQEEGGGGQES